MPTVNPRALLTAAALLAATPPAVAQVTVPHAFKAGDPIRSGEVNDNFAALKGAVDVLQAQVASLDGQLRTMGDRVSALEQANRGMPRQKGFPRVYAFVKSDGTITGSWSSTGATVTATHPSQGIYIVKYSDNSGQIYGTPAFVTPYNDPAACDVVPFNDFIEVDCYGTGAVNDGKFEDTSFFLLVLNS